MENMKRFSTISDNELMEVKGGELVITATMIGVGISYLTAGWKIGRYLKQHF